MQNFTREQLQDIAENALHAACAHMQDAIGQTDGGFAGLYFTGEVGEQIHTTFLHYLEQELSYMEVTRSAPSAQAAAPAAIRFAAYNHNGTLLGEHDTQAGAEAEAREYREQTGNAAYVEQLN